MKKIILCLSLLLTQCQQNAALQSLNSNHASEKYNLIFWLDHAKANSLLWQQAFTFCQSKHFVSPNCQFVHAAQTFQRPFPKYGTGVGFGAKDL